MKTITLEEHCASPGYLEGPGRGLKEQARIPQSPVAHIAEQLVDVGEKRIKAMDQAGIDVQVLSLTSPGTEQLSGKEAIAIAQDANDFMAGAVKRYPSRFAAFAALPTSEPASAIAELERALKTGCFKGIMINGHIGGRYLDDKFFWPILERAEALELPIYIHPTQSPQLVINSWFQGFSPQVSYMLAGAGWGWHIETALHVIRMIMGGVFDQYPRLQIITGHLGESLPFMIERLDTVMQPRATGLERPMGAYLRENVHYTFSGFNFNAPFQNLLSEVGVERIMFSADHPYASMARARAFLDSLPITAADKERIAHGNAEKLMKLA